ARHLAPTKAAQLHAARQIAVRLVEAVLHHFPRDLDLELFLDGRDIFDRHLHSDVPPNLSVSSKAKSRKSKKTASLFSTLDFRLMPWVARGTRPLCPLARRAGGPPRGARLRA